MAVTKPGGGSDYGIAYLDSKKRALDGSKSYKLHLPPKVPVDNFWAVTLYDTQTRSQLQTNNPYSRPWAARPKASRKNDDGSYDVHFRSQSRSKGKEGNWLETIPGKELVRHLADVWPARAVDQEDLASE